MDILKTETRTIALKDLHNNTGQIEGVPTNPRVLRDEHYKRLLQSLKDSNLTGVLPLKVIDHNGEWVVLGGNMRLRALQELKAKEVACIVVPSDTDAETLRKVVITDNSTFGEWDNDLLANEWDADELKDWGVELPEFDKEEEHPTAQEDDFDEQKDDIPAKVQKGDVWQLGDNRLMCGDSTSADDVAKLMDGQKAQIAFTSPPYNAGCINDGKESTKPKYGEYADNKTHDEYYSFIQSNLNLLLSVSNEVFYNIGLVSGNKREIIKLQYDFIEYFKDIIYWKKSTAAPMIQNGCINNLVEHILCFGANSSRRFENAQFSQGSYWNVIEGNNASGNEYAKIHKATFPVYLPDNIVKNFSHAGAIVLDCFGGTGTTMVACEQLGRKCYMMEIDPHYCDVIIARWEKLTGRTATKL